MKRDDPYYVGDSFLYHDPREEMYEEARRKEETYMKCVRCGRYLDEYETNIDPMAGEESVCMTCLCGSYKPPAREFVACPNCDGKGFDLWCDECFGTGTVPKHGASDGS